MQQKPDGEILVVDDDASTRTLLVRALSAAGYTCRQSENGLTAWHQMHFNPPSLILLDLEMPDLDGAELVRRLRADPNSAIAQIPTIMTKALPWSLIPFSRSSAFDRCQSLLRPSEQDDCQLQNSQKHRRQTRCSLTRHFQQVAEWIASAKYKRLSRLCVFPSVGSPPRSCCYSSQRRALKPRLQRRPMPMHRRQSPPLQRPRKSASVMFTSTAPTLP